MFEVPKGTIKVHRCVFRFDTPASPVCEYACVVTYIAIQHYYAARTKRQWLVLTYIILNIVVSMITSIVLFYLGVSYIGSMLYAWMLGSVTAGFLYPLLSPVPKIVERYLDGLSLFSKKALVFHALTLTVCTILLIGLPIGLFIIRINLFDDADISFWAKNIVSHKICGDNPDIQDASHYISKIINQFKYVGCLLGAFLGVIVDSYQFGGTSPLAFVGKRKAVVRITMLFLILLVIELPFVFHHGESDKANDASINLGKKFLWFLLLAFLPALLFCLFLYGFS